MSWCQIGIRLSATTMLTPLWRWDLLDRHYLSTWLRHQMETFSALLVICAGNSPVTGEFPHKGQWRGVLMFSLICASANGWINKGEAGDLRRHRAHYDVIVMKGWWKPVSYFVMWRFVAQNPTHSFVPVYSYIQICTHQFFEMFRKVMCSFRNMILCKINPKWFTVYNMNTVFHMIWSVCRGRNI